MSTPITWRNVTGPGNAEAAGILEQSRRSINGAFDTFGGMVANAENFQANNVRRLDEEAKQGYLNQLGAAKTPEELAALQASGALDTAFAGLKSPQQAEVRGALDARGLAVQQRALTNNAYAEQVRGIADAPLREEASGFLARGDIPGFQNFMANQGAGIAKKSDLYSAGSAAQAAAEQKRRADEDRLRLTTIERPRADRAAGRNEATADLTLAGAQRTEADRVAVEAAVPPQLQAFEAQKTDFNRQLSEIGAAGKYPSIKGTTLPDTDAMSPAQLTAFNGELKARGLDRSPTSSEYVENIRKTLIAARASPQAITTAVSQAEALIKGNTQMTPEDSALMTSQISAIDNRLEVVKKNNLFYAPPKELNSMKTAVLAKADQLVTDGPSTKTRLRETMNEWMDKGILIGGKGKQHYVQVPPKVIEAAMQAGLESDTWVWNSTAENMGEIIKNIMASPDYAQQKNEAEYFNTEQDGREKLSIQRKFKRETGTVSPSDYLDSFSKRLKLEQERAATKK